MPRVPVGRKPDVSDADGRAERDLSSFEPQAVADFTFGAECYTGER